MYLKNTISTYNHVATANIGTKSFLLTEIKLKLDGKNINFKRRLKYFPGNLLK